jgi:hypothetical protein
MAEGMPRSGDLIVVKQESMCLLRQRKPDGTEEPWGNERTSQKAVARLCVEAAQTKVTVWLADTERRYTRLIDFRKIPPQGPAPDKEPPSA